jgi:hypothetical protein
MLTYLVCLLALALLGVISVKVSRAASGLVSGSQSTTVTDSQLVQANPTVPAAQPATLSVRTNNTSGTLVMTNGNHGITTGQRVDLYWAGGHCYGATVGTVSGTSVPIASVSGGANLPSQDTAITVGIATATPFAVTGNDLQALALSTPVSGYFVFNGGSDLYAAYVTGGYVQTWVTGDTNTNPLAGVSPTQVFMSHSSTSAQQTLMQAGALTH